VLINCVVVAFAFARELYVRLRSLEAGRSMFLELVSAVLFSPMSFFDTTPLGRVINRFSKDIYTIDEQIPQTVRGYLGTMAKVISTILYICIITPMFMFGLIPIMVFYYMAQRYYIKTSRELTRLESTSRSPIYALFSETLDGLATIRAYGSERRLVEKNNRLLDSNVQSYFLNFSANCWLAVRLEFAGTLIVTFAALFAVLGRSPATSNDTVNGPAERRAFAGEFISVIKAPRGLYCFTRCATVRCVLVGLAGLAISFALSVTQSLNWTVRMASDMESQMVSVGTFHAVQWVLAYFVLPVDGQDSCVHLFVMESNPAVLLCVQSE
jgi:ATP-binding cassette subfamily C (CFTR/MRP) protein 1